MYMTTIYDGPGDGLGKVIHSPRAGAVKLKRGNINQEVNKVSSLSIEYTPNNPAYGNIFPYKTLIEVYNTITGETEFRGRVIQPSEDMSEGAEYTISWEAESELGYLKDSLQKHQEFRGTVRQALEKQIDNHNKSVESFKKFVVGIIDVPDPNDYLYFYLMQDENTLDSINRTLVDKLGGELRLRNENGVRYIDYVLLDGFVGNNEIIVKKNLRSVSVEMDPTEIVSRLVPLGERIESEDESQTDASQKRLTIASVNGGVDYIEDKELVGYYTIKTGAKVWNEITTAQALMTAGKNWLANQQQVLTHYEVKAIDLGVSDPSLDTFKCGWLYRLYNPYMKIDETLRIVKKQIDINAPENDKMIVGDIIKTASEVDIELRKQNQISYSILEAQRSKLTRDLKAMTITAENMVKENEVLKNETIPELQKNYKDIQNKYTAVQADYKSVAERLAELIEATQPDLPDPTPVEPTPAPSVDSNGYSTKRRFPVDYARSGINFWLRSSEPDMSYGPRWGSLHSGWDIGGGNRSHPIHATTDGIVRFVGYKSGGIGNCIYIEHTADDWWSNYMHLASMSVSVGQKVTAGQQIGIMGGTGGNYAIHLHYELSPNGSFHSGGNTRNPQAYLGITANNKTSLPRP